MAAWRKARITPADVKAWSSTDLAAWMADGSIVRDQVHPPAGDTALGYRYVSESALCKELQLEKGGVRLTAYLNIVLR